MLTWEEDVEAHALRKQGLSISAIARHLGRDPKTVRGYLSGKRTPGQRARTLPDLFAPYAEYCKTRLGDDPHVWASALFDEVVALGYPGAYPSFTRALRARELRPHCEPCTASVGRDHAIIAHPPGQEMQFDWLELPDPPAHWGWGSTAHLLVGALSHSSRMRAVLCESEDQAHLIEGLHELSVRLGGLPKRWRTDRMATVCHPASGLLTATFAPVAKHYSVGIDICPSRHGNRKGVVEKSNHSLAQRWWRTLSEDLTAVQAQADLDAFCVRVGDARPRTRDGQRSTVGQLADAEVLQVLPATPYPASVQVQRIVSAQALVAFRGNFYSIGPGRRGETVLVSHRLGSSTLDITTARGITLARHHRESDGAGVVVRQDEHVAALEAAVLGQFSDRAPCRSKERRPPSAAALSQAEAIRGSQSDAGQHAAGQHVVIDFARIVAAAAERTAPTPAEQVTR